MLNINESLLDDFNDDLIEDTDDVEVSGDSYERMRESFRTTSYTDFFDVVIYKEYLDSDIIAQTHRAIYDALTNVSVFKSTSESFRFYVGDVTGSIYNTHPIKIDYNFNIAEDDIRRGFFRIWHSGFLNVSFRKFTRMLSQINDALKEVPYYEMIMFTDNPNELIHTQVTAYFNDSVLTEGELADIYAIAFLKIPFNTKHKYDFYDTGFKDDYDFNRYDIVLADKMFRKQLSNAPSIAEKQYRLKMTVNDYSTATYKCPYVLVTLESLKNMAIDEERLFGCLCDSIIRFIPPVLLFKHSAYNVFVVPELDVAYDHKRPAGEFHIHINSNPGVAVVEDAEKKHRHYLVTLDHEWHTYVTILNPDGTFPKYMLDGPLKQHHMSFSNAVNAMRAAKIKFNDKY